MPMPLKPPRAAPPELFITLRSQRQTFPSIGSIIAFTRPPPSFHVRWLPFCFVNACAYSISESGAPRQFDLCTGECAYTPENVEVHGHKRGKRRAQASPVPLAYFFDINVVAPAEPATADELVR